MDNISEVSIHDNLKVYLQKELNKRCQINSSYSLRAFAKDIGVSRSTLYRVKFAAHLLTNAFLSRQQDISKDLPIFLVVAGKDEDHYVNSNDLTSWVYDKRDQGADVLGLNCPKARHEVDNEPREYGGAQVRLSSKLFMMNILENGNDLKDIDGPCYLF